MRYDVIVIGGSFAGLSAALQLARAKRNVLVIDANSPRNRFADASHGIFGLDGKSPERIREMALHQLAAYPSFTLLEDYVEKIEQTGGVFRVFASKMQAESHRLILAMGIRDELPAVDGLAQYWGKNVVHCPYCHGYELRDRDLGVLATSEMSLHQAAMLPDWGVTTLFTQNEFMPNGDLEALLQRRGVQIENSPVVRVQGNDRELRAVVLASGEVVALGGLYIGPKIQVMNSIVEGLSLVLTDSPLGSIVDVDAFKESSVKGVFVAGDMSNPMQSGSLAIASGALAGIGAHRSLIFGT